MNREKLNIVALAISGAVMVAVVLSLWKTGTINDRPDVQQWLHSHVRVHDIELANSRYPCLVTGNYQLRYEGQIVRSTAHVVAYFNDNLSEIKLGVNYCRVIPMDIPLDEQGKRLFRRY